MANYLEYTKKLLSNGAMLSSSVEAKLIKRFNISENNARKQISTFVKNRLIFSSKPLFFEHGSVGLSCSSEHNSFKPLLSSSKSYLIKLFNYVDKFHAISTFEIKRISGCKTDDSGSQTFTLKQVLSQYRFFRPLDFDPSSSFYYPPNEKGGLNESIREINEYDRSNLRTIRICIKTIFEY